MPRPDRDGRTTLIVFACLFLVPGLIAVFWIGVLPCWRSFAAADWLVVPCDIDHCAVTSRVRSGNRGKTRRSYSIECAFRYEVHGQSYRGNRYGLSDSGSSSNGWREAAVAELLARELPVCYVDPADPERAVLDRGVTPDLWYALIGVPFVAFGVGMLAFGWRTGTRLRQARSAAGFDLGAVAHPSTAPSDAADAVSSLTDDPWCLIGTSWGRGPGSALPTYVPPTEWSLRRARHDRFHRSLGVIVFAAFLAGVIAVALMTMSGAWWMAWGDVLPWLGIGFVLVLIVPSARLGLRWWMLRQPGIDLALSRTVVPAGGHLDLRWRLTGPTERITGFSIVWVAHEVVIERRRKGSGRVHRAVVTEIGVVDQSSPAQTGALRVAAPALAMPSFDARCLRIEWALRVRVAIALSPDADEILPMVLLPAEDAP